jgi:hypothetical protein
MVEIVKYRFLRFLSAFLVCYVVPIKKILYKTDQLLGTGLVPESMNKDGSAVAYDGNLQCNADCYAPNTTRNVSCGQNSTQKQVCKLNCVCCDGGGMNCGQCSGIGEWVNEGSCVTSGGGSGGVCTDGEYDYAVQCPANDYLNSQIGDFNAEAYCNNGTWEYSGCRYINCKVSGDILQSGVCLCETSCSMPNGTGKKYLPRTNPSSCS